MNYLIKIINAQYGVDNNYINITSKVKTLFFKNGSLKMCKGTNLNELFTNPCILLQKMIKIELLVNETVVNICESENNGELLNDIIVDEEFIFYNHNKYKNENNNEFRILCYNHINYIRNLNLPSFCERSDYESVLIEYRCLYHLEFLIRNTIIKLGDKWCHTIICGNLNYDYTVNICSSISNKIKIIKTNHDKLYPVDYNKFMKSLEFWKLLHGEKILIYDENSIIFKNNISDFLKWDYISSHLPEVNNHNNTDIGSAGLSLRTKKIMIEIINRVNYNETKLTCSSIDNMRNSDDSFFHREDVYFCKNMKSLGIGLLPDINNASNFSTESIVNTNSFGGHNFWLNDPQWKNRIFENIVVKFKPSFNLSIFEHRGGWKSILQNLIDNNFYNNDSNFEFFDILEFKFMWNPDTTFRCHNKWAGIVHCTPKTPWFLNLCNINNLFTNENFIESLENCIFIITLSNYISDFLQCKFNEMNKNIPIYTLKYPVDTNNIKLFNFDNYINNDDKKLIQIGQQLRKVTSIYLLNVNNFKKIWLTGTRNLDGCKQKLHEEMNYFNYDKNILNNQVNMYYTNTFEEYDDLLSENIVFIDLFDAGANTVILECIIRNTPVIVNKLPPVVEYLGDNYPLYFDNLNDVPSLLTNEKLLDAHNYLCKMNKEELSIHYFTKQIINITNKTFVE
jgi:hypothetical protein